MPSDPGPRTAAVFGGTGFLGRAVVAALARAGWRVRVAVRRPQADAFATLAPQVSQVAGDVRDEAAVARALEGVEAAVNAVGLYAQSREDRFEAVHVAGAGRVAGAAAARAADLVHISGIGADPASPSAYVRARAAGESAVRAAAPRAVVLRPSVLFGPGDAFLSTLARVTRMLPVAPLFGRGDTRLAPVFVDDVAAAVVQALTLPQCAGETFELGGPQAYRYRELLALVQRHLGRRRPALPLPFALWEALAIATAWLPGAPLTRDQVVLMRHDNLPAPALPGFDRLALRPRALEDLLARCLAQP